MIDPAPQDGTGSRVPPSDLPSTELPAADLPSIDVPLDDGPGAPSGATEPAIARRAFAHASEAEMARILDFYGVEWRYEPTTFPILWNLEGDVVESFSPDFFLPEFDLYLEMTTLKQSLVRKKNRKLRRLRELYPDIRIKLFYARDFRAMMLKYGRFGLARSLTGTSGQLVGGELPRPIADALGVSDVEVAPVPARTPRDAALASGPDAALRRRPARSSTRGALRGRSAPAGNRPSEPA